MAQILMLGDQIHSGPHIWGSMGRNWFVEALLSVLKRKMTVTGEEEVSVCMPWTVDSQKGLREVRKVVVCPMHHTPGSVCSASPGSYRYRSLPSCKVWGNLKFILFLEVRGMLRILCTAEPCSTRSSVTPTYFILFFLYFPFFFIYFSIPFLHFASDSLSSALLFS